MNCSLKSNMLIELSITGRTIVARRLIAFARFNMMLAEMLAPWIRK